MKNFLILLLMAVFANLTHGQTRFTVSQDCLRIQDGICIDKNEVGYVDGATSNIQTQINGLVNDTAYDATTWNGVTATAPSKNAVRDVLESIIASIPSVSDTAYNATSWDGVTTIAPSKNAVRDEVESIKSTITANDGLAVHKAGSETITGDKLFTGQLTSTSTTFGNRPCPVMTDAQMLAIGSPSNGDCVYNSTKKGQYVYSSVDVKWKPNGGGGGGGTRLELMIDGSFEDGVTADGSCTTCVASQVNAPMTTPTNEKAIQLAFTASTGSFTVTKTTGANFAGVDGVVSGWFTVPAAATGCYFKSMVNGAETGDSTLMINDGVPHYYAKSVVVGATSIGYKVDCIVSFTGNIIGDETSAKMDRTPALLSYVQNTSGMASCTVTGTWIANTTYTCLYRRIGEFAEFEILVSVSGAPTSASLEVDLPSGFVIDTAKLSSSDNTNSNALPSSLSTVKDFGTANYPSSQVVYVDTNTVRPTYDNGSIASNITQAAPITFASGDFVRLSFKVPIVGWAATNPNFLTAPETFSSDYTPLTFCSSATCTLANLSSQPVGTLITFTYASSTNTRSGCTTAPTQTTSDMSTNGILIYSRAYSATSTCGNPTAMAIQIGKKLKGLKLDVYKSSGKTTSGNISPTIANSLANVFGLRINTYDETTGILYLDAGYEINQTASTVGFIFTDLTTQTSGYLVINSSKNPALTGLNAVTNKTAVITDVRSSGTNGGTSTSGSWQTRTLNTLVDPYGIVTSLSSNQITLPKGTYFIEGCGVVFRSSFAKNKIFNVTDNVDILIGHAEYSNDAASNASVCPKVAGYFSLTSPKAIALMSRVNATRANDGYGIASSFGESEVYANIKITQIVE
jgi:hypothetical protein